MTVDPVLSFLGAAGTVTGSRFLVEHGGSRLLVEAGLFQGLRALRRRNWDPFAVAPESIDAVVVTHAHLDHIGYLPRLARQGFAGPVLLTPDTAALAEIVLRDSAKLLEEDAQYAGARGYSKHARPEPLYDSHDVDRTLALLTPVGFGERVDLADGASVLLARAGHILGSATARVETGERSLVFSGDLGRPDHPLLLPPDPPSAADAIVVESTYGDRAHPAEHLEPLAAAITRTADRGGSVIIPAFAVDRTEVILMALHELRSCGRIPDLPVHVDSPMALAALDVYRRALDLGLAKDVQPLVGDDPFDRAYLHEARTADESARLNHPSQPCVIISASGMATGGRILHHLKAMLPDARNSVILVGYQAVGTRGRDLAEGARQVKMHGQYVPVEAEVVDLAGFSVHADASEMVAWLGTAPEPPAAVYVVHGEPEAAQALAQRIRRELGWLAVVPNDGESVRVTQRTPAV